MCPAHHRPRITRRGCALWKALGLRLTLLVSHYSPSLPALDWQLPSHSGPYELRIEVQPKSHHRAHYETEGSRGAVKASAGGHPSVQVPFALSPRRVRDAGAAAGAGLVHAAAADSAFHFLSFQKKRKSPS